VLKRSSRALSEDTEADRRTAFRIAPSFRGVNRFAGSRERSFQLRSDRLAVIRVRLIAPIPGSQR
jgi:hypothetical protein